MDWVVGKPFSKIVRCPDIEPGVFMDYLPAPSSASVDVVPAPHRALVGSNLSRQG